MFKKKINRKINAFTKIDFLCNEAKKEAHKNNGVGFTSKQLLYKHGAILANDDGVIISRACNRMSLNGDFKEIEETLRVRMSYDGKCSVHAELDCFAKLAFDQKKIKGTTLVIYGESRGKNMIKSRPCANCMRLISLMRVKRIVYSVGKNQWAFEKVEF